MSMSLEERSKERKEVRSPLCLRSFTGAEQHWALLGEHGAGAPFEKTAFKGVHNGHGGE